MHFLLKAIYAHYGELLHLTILNKWSLALAMLVKL
jgi:hypothetical protein